MRKPGPRFNRKAAVVLPQKGARGAKHGWFHRIFPGQSLHSMGETKSCGRTGLVPFILRFLRFFAAVPFAGFRFNPGFPVWPKMQMNAARF
jgi:hypothetical protein